MNYSENQVEIYEVLQAVRYNFIISLHEIKNFEPFLFHEFHDIYIKECFSLLPKLPRISIPAILQAILHARVSCLRHVIKLHGFLDTSSETVQIIAGW